MCVHVCSCVSMCFFHCLSVFRCVPVLSSSKPQRFSSCHSASKCSFSSCHNVHVITELLNCWQHSRAPVAVPQEWMMLTLYMGIAGAYMFPLSACRSLTRVAFAYRLNPWLPASWRSLHGPMWTGARPASGPEKEGLGKLGRMMTAWNAGATIETLLQRADWHCG